MWHFTHDFHRENEKIGGLSSSSTLHTFVPLTFHSPLHVTSSPPITTTSFLCHLCLSLATTTSSQPLLPQSLPSTWSSLTRWAIRFFAKHLAPLHPCAYTIRLPPAKLALVIEKYHSWPRGITMDSQKSLAPSENSYGCQSQS
jgi:hypothetical protein